MDPRSTAVSHKLSPRFIHSFGFLLVTTGPLAFLLYFGLIWSQGEHGRCPVTVFNGYFGYDLWEISQHPFPFLLSIALFLSLAGSLWLSLVAPRLRRFSILQVLAVPWIALLMTCPVWGLLWSLYRWPPGGFQDPQLMLLFYLHDIGVGLSLGWLSALVSFPINLLSYASVCSLLLVGRRLFVRPGAKDGSTSSILLNKYK